MRGGGHADREAGEMTDYPKHARAASDCTRGVIAVVIIGILLIVAFGFMLGVLTGCKTTQHARQEREIAAKAAHKRAYQKEPLPQSAMMIWWSENWKEVLVVALGGGLVAKRKGRKG